MQPATFSNIAAEIFSAVAARHGLSLTQSAPGTCLFEKKDMRLSVIWDVGRSLDASVCLSRIPSQDPPYELSEVLGAANIGFRLSTVGISSVSEARVGLVKLRELVELTAAPLLEGDALAWLRLDRFRKAASEKLERDAKLRSALVSAGLAWARRDYATVVSTLAAIRKILPPTEVRRLELAEKKSAHRD